MVRWLWSSNYCLSSSLCDGNEQIHDDDDDDDGDEEAQEVTLVALKDETLPSYGNFNELHVPSVQNTADTSDSVRSDEQPPPAYDGDVGTEDDDQVPTSNRLIRL